MESLYGEIPNNMIIKNEDDLINQIFKLLPYKENNIDNLDYHFNTLLFRITGLCKLFPGVPELLTVVSLLESAKSETDFQLYRKAILDSCSIIKRIQKRLGDSNV